MNESRTLRNMIGYNKESSTPTCTLKEDVADDTINAKTHANKRRTKGFIY